MRPLLIVLVALSTGCEMNYMDPNEWAQCEEDGPVFHTRTDPNHCGGCYVKCAADVPCDDWTCQYNTALHCGEPHRQCLAPDGQGVACVGSEDDDQVDGVAVVNSFACMPIPRPETGPTADDEPPVVIDDEPTPTYKRAQWLGIPGHSEQCSLGVDHRLCQQASVEFTDLCGNDVAQSLAYDFEIMTTEVSRAQYRATMCGDCNAPETELCASVCRDLDAPDQEERDARPMTRLSWCDAYTVCKEMGARIPTVQERARVEALAHGSRALFRQATSCSGWIRETGRAPWLAECFDDPPEMLGFDRVDGPSGQLLFGVDVLSIPQVVHHLLGNVDEWLADPAETMTTQALLDGPRRWTASSTIEESVRPRLARGRSFLSPAGQAGSRMLILDPSVNADDLGVRCARTSRSPYTDPVPYDYTVEARLHALCEKEASGLRPVRQMSGERVYRAREICIDAPMPTRERRVLSDLLRRQLVGDDRGMARVSLVNGQLMGLGLARFAVDEQWWLVDPIREAGDVLRLETGGVDLPLAWAHEAPLTGEHCIAAMGDPEQASTDGAWAAVQVFEVTRAQLAVLLRGADSAQVACAHLDCVDDRIPPNECAARCLAWHLPVAVSFERVEPFDRASMCVASTDNPAER